MIKIYVNIVIVEGNNLKKNKYQQNIIASFIFLK
jgi:hypothetical protein